MSKERMAAALLAGVGAGIGVLLFSTGSEWLHDGSHGQAGWLLRIGGGVVLLGGVLLARRWRPGPQSSWPRVVLAGACVAAIGAGILVHTGATSVGKPVGYQENTLPEPVAGFGLSNGGWYSRDGSPTVSPSKYRRVKLYGVGSWVLMIGGALGLGVLALNEVRRRPSLPPPRPPGWHPDPQGEATRRWWDGNQWTAHTSD